MGGGWRVVQDEETHVIPQDGEHSCLIHVNVWQKNHHNIVK